MARGSAIINKPADSLARLRLSIWVQSVYQDGETHLNLGTCCDLADELGTWMISSALIVKFGLLKYRCSRVPFSSVATSILPSQRVPIDRQQPQISTVGTKTWDPRRRSEKDNSHGSIRHLIILGLSRSVRIAAESFDFP